MRYKMIMFKSKLFFLFGICILFLSMFNIVSGQTTPQSDIANTWFEFDNTSNRLQDSGVDQVEASDNTMVVITDVIGAKNDKVSANVEGQTLLTNSDASILDVRFLAGEFVINFFVFWNRNPTAPITIFSFPEDGFLRTGNDQYIDIFLDTDGQIRVDNEFMPGFSNIPDILTGVLNDSRYHMITYVFHQADVTVNRRERLYVDGVLINNNAANCCAADFNNESSQIGWISGNGGSGFNLRMDEFQIYDQNLEDANISAIFTELTGGVCGDNNNLPEFITATYSSTFIRQYENVNLLVAANDIEDNTILFANDCEFSEFGSEDEVTILVEDFPEDGNRTRFKIDWGVDFLNESYDNWFTVNTLIGSVLNLSDVDTGVSDLIRQVSNTTAGITNNIVSTHWLIGKTGPTVGDDGVFFEARDNDNVGIWGLFSTFNNTGLLLHKVNPDGTFSFLQQTSFSRFRIQVTHDIFNQRYYVEVDNDLDGDFDFISDSFPVLNNITNTEYNNFRMFTTPGEVVPENIINLSIGTPNGVIFFDTFIVNVIDKPSFLPSTDPRLDETGNKIGEQRPFICTYNDVGTRIIRTYTTDVCDPSKYEVFIDQTIVVVDKIENLTLPESGNFLLPSESENLLEIPQGCKGLCVLVWLVSFPSKFAGTMDQATGLQTVELMTKGNVVGTFFLIVILLWNHINFNTIIIRSYFWTLFTFFVGFQTVTFFILHSFILAIIVGGWFRSHETGLTGTMGDANVEQR